jgi:hypothetical protein
MGVRRPRPATSSKPIPSFAAIASGLALGALVAGGESCKKAPRAVEPTDPEVNGFHQGYGGAAPVHPAPPVGATLGGDGNGPHAVAPGHFDENAANASLAQAAMVVALGACNNPGGPTGHGHVRVTFGPDGRSAKAKVVEPLAFTPTGECVAKEFEETARVPPYDGPAQTRIGGFDIPGGH